MHFKNALFLFTFSLITTLNSCGIYSFSGSSIPKNAKTVYIEPINNNSTLSSPELTQLVTTKMNNYVLTQTKLKLSEINPDLSFSGKITKYTISPISINSEDNASQNRLLIELEISFENALNTSQNFVKKFSNYIDFNSSENFIDLETELNILIIDKLVEDVFRASFLNW